MIQNESPLEWLLNAIFFVLVCNARLVHFGIPKTNKIPCTSRRNFSQVSSKTQKTFRPVQSRQYSVLSEVVLCRIHRAGESCGMIQELRNFTLDSF